MNVHVAFDCGGCVPESAAQHHRNTCTLCHELRSQS